MLRTISSPSSSSSSHLFFSSSPLIPLRRRSTLSVPGPGVVRLRSASSSTAELRAAKSAGDDGGKAGFREVRNLTTWLLKKEQIGEIDSELAIVLSSISLAAKQIAALLQRSSITNLTGGYGTINIQGEDQKKLDVISNEVSSCSSSLPI